MNARRHTILSILATGVVVLTLFAVVLFWASLLCRRTHQRLLSNAVGDVRIQPSGLFDFERGKEPNVVAPSAVSARMSADDVSSAGLGIARYVLRWLLEGPDAYTYTWGSGPDSEWLYYDPSLGQMVHRGATKETGPDGRQVLRHFTCYAGPESVAQTPDRELGRFVSPVACRHVVRPWIVYDRGLRRFFAIDWQDRTIRSGPVLPENDTHRPVQVGALEKNPLCLSVIFEPPSLRKPDEQSPEGVRRERDGRDEKPLVVAGPLLDSDRILVLDASGRIDLLDSETLEFAGAAGFIPAPTTLFGSSRPVGPDAVAAFSVLPVSMRDRGTTSEWRYTGCIVAAISRDGTAMRLGAFDKDGQLVAGEEMEVCRFARTNQGTVACVGDSPSAQAVYSAFPGAPALTITRFTLQSLHPPALLLLSYFTASSLEATAGGRSILLLPDSFVAMKARDRDSGRIDRFFTALFFMLPSIGLGAVLAWRVSNDAVKTGLSANARSVWVIGTILLGLPAYITYRLTRPRVALVTCQDCGLGRRPDAERCHRCGSQWLVPELTPPAWRVLGEEEQDEAGSPSQAEEMSSPEV